MKILILIAAFFLGLLSAQPARSQILFKNNSKAQIYLAVCRYVADGGYWMTRGWFTINGGGISQVFDRISPKDTIGYWAMTTIMEEKFEGKKNLIVNDDAVFSIKNADQPETMKKNSNYTWKKFILLRLPAGTTKGTIQFK